MKIVDFQILPKDTSNRVYSELYILNDEGKLYSCLLTDTGLPVGGSTGWSLVTPPADKKKRKTK